MTPIIVKYISDRILCLSYNCRGGTCEGNKLVYDEFCVNCACLTPNQEEDLKMELFYKVVNREWNQSLQESFSDFMPALKARDEWDYNAIIECHSSDGVEVVFDPSWEEFTMGNELFLNNNTPLKVVSKK